MSAVETSIRVESRSPELREMARAAAASHAVPANEVLVRLLLHLPREADARAMVGTRVAAAESKRVASKLAAATRAYCDWHLPPNSLAPQASDLSLAPVSEGTARIVLERFHYLGSFRHSSEHLGGVVSSHERPAAMLTASELDVPTIAAALPAGLSSADVTVLSRVFAFEWAPANSLSYLISRLIRRLRDRHDPPRLLLTYLNPNVGFTGASYRASNLVLWAREAGTRYAYLDGHYVTDRELHRQFGSAEPGILAQMLGDRISFSQMPMAPLDLYAYPVDPALRPLLDGSPIDLPRPPA